MTKDSFLHTQEYIVDRRLPVLARDCLRLQMLFEAA